MDCHLLHMVTLSVHTILKSLEEFFDDLNASCSCEQVHGAGLI